MKMSRRKMLKLSLGATQMALLSGLGLREASARDLSDFPDKFVALWIPGGCHWESFFSPLNREAINNLIPAPLGGFSPWGYSPEQVRNFDNTAHDVDDPSSIRKLAGPIYWNWNDPTDKQGLIPESNDTQRYRTDGYAFADPAHKLYERTVLLAGADQGTAAHRSGIIASMCGIAGSIFQVPALHALIARSLANRFPDRPLHNIHISGVPAASVNLPSKVRPLSVSSADVLVPTLSDQWDNSWKGLRTRVELENLGIDGSMLSGNVNATYVDRALLQSLRAHGALSSDDTQFYMEQIYDTYKNSSNLLARDVVSILEQTPDWEYTNPDWTTCIGVADSCGSGKSIGDFGFVLKLLKSGLTSCVNMKANGLVGATFDTHIADGPQIGANHLRITMEGIARFCIEMMLTPGSRPGKTLLDETLVYVYSDFGRTFPRGSDHNPLTCAMLIGGHVNGNQMIGGYKPVSGSTAQEVPVDIDDSGQIEMIKPRSQHVATTVLSGFGLELGQDFEITGGAGSIQGVYEDI